MPTRLVAVLLAFSLGPSCGYAISLYQVGNSFTFDSKPEGTELMLEVALGVEVDLGYHVRGNQTLDSLWNNPDGDLTFTTDFGKHPVALPSNDWDFLTLQTFSSNSGTTLGEEIARIQDFVSAADQGSGGTTEIVVYGPWAGRTGGWGFWEDPAPLDPETATRTSAAYHDTLYDAVEMIYPGRVRLASAGRVIRELRTRIEAGEGPSEIAAIADLYRDPIHLSRLGRFVASTTVLTTITRQNPVGVPVPRDEEDGWSVDDVSDDLAIELQQIVWEVVTADKRSGVSPLGDFNLDTVVDTADRDAWVASYGDQNQPTTDLNGDRVVDALDEQLFMEIASEARSDTNNDGVLGPEDLAPWREHYGLQQSTDADFNNDGVVNAADYTVWRDDFERAQTVDFNGDGTATIADLEILRSQFGWARYLPQDGNNDGVVNAADYTAWRDAYDLSSTAGAIPEPSTLAGLLAAGLLTVATRRRTVV